jgi:hypothetical protein
MDLTAYHCAEPAKDIQPALRSLRAKLCMVEGAEQKNIDHLAANLCYIITLATAIPGGLTILERAGSLITEASLS